MGRGLLVPDVGVVRFGRCGPKLPKIFTKIFDFFREVTPGSPSPQKPHINTGIRSNTALLSQQPVWGVFGVQKGMGVAAVWRVCAATGSLAMAQNVPEMANMQLNG